MPLVPTWLGEVIASTAVSQPPGQHHAHPTASPTLGRQGTVTSGGVNQVPAPQKGEIQHSRASHCLKTGLRYATQLQHPQFPALLTQLSHLHRAEQPQTCPSEGWGRTRFELPACLKKSGQDVRVHSPHTAL